MTRQLLLLLSVLALPWQAPAQDCKALVETVNGLFVADATGRILSTVASNVRGPFVAAFAPDGRLIAYSPAQPATEVVLADLKGRVVSETEIEQPAVTAVIRLGWAGPNRLWYEGHTGPHLGAFELWELPENFDLRSRKVALTAYGHACALSGDATAVACLGETSGSGKRFIVIKQGAGREDPNRGGEEVYPDPPRDADATSRFEGGLAWSQDGQHLAAVQVSDNARWLLILQREQGGWQTQRRPLADLSEPVERIGFAEDSVILEGPHGAHAVSLSRREAEVGTAIADRALPRRLTLVGAGKVPVLDWFCARASR